MSSIYGEYESCLQQVMAEVRASLEAYDKKVFQETGEHIYEHFNMRIKQDQSMREKCRRKGLPETAYSALHELRDAIGLRIVTAFRDDIRLIVEEIRRMERVTVVNEKDYIRHAKPNGYRSYHMVLQVTTDFPDVEGNIPGKYYVGVSVMNLLGAHSDEIMFSNARYAYAMGGFEYVPSSAPSVRIKPSALLKTANLSYFQADLTCLIDYRNAFWGGLGYRVQDAVYALAGIHWKKLQVGVSYDFTTSRLGAYKFGRSMGSIELYMKFCFKVVVPRKPNTSYGNTIMLE